MPSDLAVSTLRVLVSISLRALRQNLKSREHALQCIPLRSLESPGKSLWSWKVLENHFGPGKSLWSWKVLENHFGPGKSWKITLVLESPGKISLKITHFSIGSKTTKVNSGRGFAVDRTGKLTVLPRHSGRFPVYRHGICTSHTSLNIL